MAFEFRLQDPGEGIHEVEIREVLVSPGDEVSEGQSVLLVESDKAAIELPAPRDGVIDEIRVDAGDMVEVGEVLLTIAPGSERREDEPRQARAGNGEPAERGKAGRDEGEPGEEDQAAEAAPEQAERTDEKEPEEPAESRRASRREDGETVQASPVARRIAAQKGVDLEAVEATGPHGRVLADDVREAAGGERPEGKAGRKESAGADRKTKPDFARWGEIERVPLRSIRRATARRMARAWSEIPHVTHQDVVDVTELEAFRRRHASDGDGKLTVTVLAIKATVAALKAHPRFNASLDAETDELILKCHYHIGVAVDTDRGLLVPVVRDADRKSALELAEEVTTLAEQARGDSLDADAMRGGTFTITNVGPLGGSGFTPIINHPQVAILGIAEMRLEPVATGTPEDFEIKARLRLPLCLAFDHRVVDGADAARFMATLVETLTDVETLALSA